MFMTHKVSKARVQSNNPEPVPEQIEELYEEYKQVSQIDSQEKKSQMFLEEDSLMTTDCNTSAKHGSVTTFTNNTNNLAKRGFPAKNGRIYMS